MVRHQHSLRCLRCITYRLYVRNFHRMLTVDCSNMSGMTYPTLHYAKNRFSSCQIGNILQTVASTPTPTPQTLSSLLASPEIIFKLVFLSVLSLAPILGRTRLRAMIPISTHSPNREDQETKWSLVDDWRTKTGMSAQRPRDQQHSINIEEKSRD
jgi:hypothetical protein